MRIWKIACWICILSTLIITSCQKENDLLGTSKSDLTNHVHTRDCGSMHLLQKQLDADPKMVTRRAAIERQIDGFKLSAESREAGVITIPVVVHILYNSPEQNISDEQILSQIKVLNDDFRRLNGDANNNWSQAADIEIEFCLASVDPDGNSTNGITRTSTNVGTFGVDNDAIKANASGGKDPWPTSDYLNMWVGNIEGGILGYAQFPGGPAATDGVVMGYQYFGTTGTAQAPFNLGRTTTHEVGHYLNLYHIWGDGPCGQDDLVTDTPESDDANYGCEAGHTSCGTVDMVQNYMDYSDDACMNLFTAGQKTRMRALFGDGGARTSLLNSNGCGNGTNPPAATCDDGIQNGDETGVDCGGSKCPPCETNPTCEDGIQNGDEEGVDCGGSKCPPCEVEPSCDDGIQNGDETGVDCGGSQCPPCDTNPSPCEDGLEITLVLQPDDFGSEITWEVIDDYGDIIAEGGPYEDFNTELIEESFCITEGCFEFVIYDDWGDGICCDYGYGYYELVDEDGFIIVESDGYYGFYESQFLCFEEALGCLIKETKEDTKAAKAMKVQEIQSGVNPKIEIQNLKKDSKVQILDDSGKVVMTFDSKQKLDIKTLNLNTIKKGTYTVKAGKRGKEIVQRIELK